MATPTTPNLHEPAGSSSGLHRVITLRHAVALYVSSLLGSGIFIIPGLAARIAGPASILSWIILSVASYPFAYTFAKLSARRPESGGIYVFAREGLGVGAGAATAWLFLAWAVLGAPAATVAAASYHVRAPLEPTPRVPRSRRNPHRGVRRQLPGDSLHGS